MYIEKYKASYLSFFLPITEEERLEAVYSSRDERSPCDSSIRTMWYVDFLALSHFYLTFLFLFFYFYFFCIFLSSFNFRTLYISRLYFFISSILFISWQQKEHHPTSRIIYCYIGGAAIRTTVSANWFYLTSLCFPSSPVFSVSDAF